MSTTTMGTPSPALAEQVWEVRGIFADDAALQEAIRRLTVVGFDRADLSLPHAHVAPADATPERGASDPDADDDSQQMRTLKTSLAGSVGALAAAGAVIATGGAAIPAIAAAAAAGLGAGGLASAVGSGSATAERNRRETAANRGELVLSVRVRDRTLQARAESELRAAGANDLQSVTSH